MFLLSVSHFYQVTYFVYHTHHGRIVLMDNHVIHFLKAEGVESALLHCRTVDAALYLLDFNLCHCFGFLAFEHFLYRDATVLGHLCRRAQFTEGLDCGLDRSEEHTSELQSQR